MGGVNSGRPKGSLGGGRPKGSKFKLPKTSSGISMTREAWVILANRSQQMGMNKSEYIESLIRKGDSSVYDLVCHFLIEHYKQINNDLELSRKKVQQQLDELEQLEQHNREIREFLLEIGVSPNQIPD